MVEVVVAQRKFSIFHLCQSSRFDIIFCQVVEIPHVPQAHTISYRPYVLSNLLWNVGITWCCCCCFLLFSIFSNDFSALHWCGCCLEWWVSKIDSTRWRKISQIHTTVCFNLPKLFTLFLLLLYAHIYDRTKSDNPKLFAFIYFHFFVRALVSSLIHALMESLVEYSYTQRRAPAHTHTQLVFHN